MENIIENTEIEAFEQKIKELEKELFMTKAEAEINIAIAMARPRNIAAAKAMLDKEGLLTEDGIDRDVLAKKIEKLKDENPWLFKNTKTETMLYSSGINFGFGEFTDPAELSDDEYYNKIMK